MQAIEFETIPHEHSIHLPEQIPDGVKLRVLILFEDTVDTPTKPISTPLNRPSSRLIGSVKMQDDLIQPALPESEWNVLK